MTAQIIPFPTPIIEGETPTAMPSGYDLAPPTANRFAHIESTPKSTPKRRRKQRAKMRAEQVEVTCTKVPRQHRDLRALRGVLTIDWKGETPWTATFDPDEESIPNIVAPIEGFKRSADAIEVACDEGTWVFALIADDDCDDEE